MSTPIRQTVLLDKRDGTYVGRFHALGSPCEVLLVTDDAAQARHLVTLAAAEAWRIEEKYSRYLTGSVIYRINNAGGKTLMIDEETANLLDYAALCHKLSDGRFDITAGVLRKAWRFDGRCELPKAKVIRTLLKTVGWHQVRWQRPALTLGKEMEIDLGGIGKEYAVDRAAAGLMQHTDLGAVVNFGGDIYVTGPQPEEMPWHIGIDDPHHTGLQTLAVAKLKQGGMATSGDARRFLMHQGKRYGHLLDPRTGWPVAGAPRSITAFAGTCTEAGMLATFAMLYGPAAESFLTAQEVRHYSVR